MRVFPFTIIALISFVYLSSAQNQKIIDFTGDYRVSEDEIGIAKYSYIEGENNEIIKEGSFDYFFEKYNSNGKYIKRKIQGKFVKNLKEGKWSYETNYFDVDIKSINERFQLNASVNGVVQKADAEFSQGKATGLWKIEETIVQDGRSVGQRKVLNTNFSDGRMIGNFYYKTYDGGEIRGRFNENHYFDGKWVLKYIKDSIEYAEERVYDDGFLISLVQSDVTNNLTLYDIEYERVEEKLKNVRSQTTDLPYAIGNEYFGLLFDDGFPVFSDEELSQSGGNEFLNEAFDLLVEKEFLSNVDLEGIVAINQGATRRFEYTFTESELIVLEQTKVQLDQYISNIEKFINNTTLSLNRQRSDSLAYNFRLLNSTLNKLNILRDNVERLKGSEFKFQSRNTFYKDGIEGINRYDTIRYSYNNAEKLRVFDNEVSVTNGDGIILNIKKYVDKKVELVDRLDPFLKESIIDIEKDLVSQQLEEDIVTYIAKVEDKYDVARGFDNLDMDSIPLTNLHIDLYARYEKLLEGKMQEYSEAEGFEEKQAAGLRIIGLSEAFLQAYELAGVQREMIKRLDEAYTKYTYNPYMDRHDIKTRIKRNIYFATIDYLIPSFRTEMVSVNTAEELLDITNDFEKMFDRLFSIAKMEDSETRTIERRLRRETNPSRIKRILDI